MKGQHMYIVDMDQSFNRLHFVLHKINKSTKFVNHFHSIIFMNATYNTYIHYI